MSFKVGLFILTAGMLLIGLLYILPTIVTLLWYFVLFLFIGLGLSLATFGVLKGLIAKERYLTTKAERKAKEFVLQVDGHGMLHLIHVNGHTQNLTINANAYRNGHYEAPSPHEVMAFNAIMSKGRQLEATASNLTIEQLPQLLSVIGHCERVLVKGPSNAGKTTLFQNIASQSPNCIVIDPHYAPGIWPEHTTIIGKGRNHAEIDHFFEWLSSELDRRYKLRAEGNESYPILTIIIDEWMSIAQRCDNAQSVIVEMITESRKSKMRLFIGSHSDQVEALGIKGQGKLREGLLIVRLYFDQFTNERSATFDYGKGERSCVAPAGYSSIELALPQFCLPVLELSDIEQKVQQLLDSGKSRSAIARELYGSVGGNQVAKIDEIIEKLGL